MTLREARKMFREAVAKNITILYGSYDTVALDTAFNDWTDMLCKEGIITEHQYNTWTRT